MQHAHGLDIPQTLEDVCDPQRLALVVYDMQVGVLSQIEGAEAVVARVAQTVDAARAAGIRVAWTRHMSLPRAWMGASAWRMAMAWQHAPSPDTVQPWFARGAPGFEIAPPLMPLPSEVVFDKLTMSAFEGTPLPMALRDCGLQAFAIVGVALEIGIEPTVRHGADLGFVPVVVADACGAGNAEAARRSLDSLAFTGDALLTDTAAFGAALQRLVGGCDAPVS